MNQYDLKYKVESAGITLFFDRESMRFFGDTMKNYGVRPVTITDNSGDQIEAWELYRKRPVKFNNQESVYFDKQTFKRVFKKRG